MQNPEDGFSKKLRILPVLVGIWLIRKGLKKKRKYGR